MSKRRVPTKVLEMSGAFKRNPARARSRRNEPQPEGGIGEPPAEFLKTESGQAQAYLAIWNDLLARCPVGVLTSADYFHVKNTVKLQYKADRNTATGAELKLLEGALGKMGMNPADRSRVATTKRKPGSEASDFQELRDAGRKARTG